jgi:hypothetical protein
MILSLFKALKGFPHENGSWSLQSGGTVELTYCTSYNCSPTTEAEFDNLDQITNQKHLIIDTDSLSAGTYSFKYTVTQNTCNHEAVVTLIICP